jgi:hypothetical protein
MVLRIFNGVTIFSPIMASNTETIDGLETYKTTASSE